MLNWILEKLGFIAPKIAKPETTTPVENMVKSEPDDIILDNPVSAEIEQPAKEQKRVRKAKQTSYLKQRKTPQKKM